MSERIQRRRSRQTTDEAQVAEASTASTTPSVADYDAILAEIDEVLATDAEDYVKSFVQKGGQ